MTANLHTLPATTMLDAQLSGPIGAEVVACPTYAVGPLMLYPRPTVEHAEDGQPIAVHLDLRRWLISHPSGWCLPIECTSLAAASAAADQFLRDEHAGRTTGVDPSAATQWAHWWSEQRTDADVLPTANPAGGGR